MSGSAILTNTGLLKIASASPLDQLTITDIAVGDGVNPLSPTATGLVNEVYRDTASTPIRSTTYPDTLVFELNIPPTTGGFTVREIGAFDSEGDLIAVGTLDEIAKPTDGINLTVQINVKLQTASQVDVFYDNQGAIDFEGLRNRNSSALLNDDGLTAQNTHDATKAILIAQGQSGNYGFFEKGFTYNVAGDAGIDVDGKIYTYAGSDPLPVSVTAGTDPVGDSDYTALNFQSHTAVAKIASGDFGVGQSVIITDRDNADFKIVAGGVPNGFDILDAGSGNTAVLQHNGKVTLKSLGAVENAKGDGVESGTIDDSDVIEYAASKKWDVVVSGKSLLSRSVLNLASWYGVLSGRISQIVIAPSIEVNNPFECLNTSDVTFEKIGFIGSSVASVATTAGAIRFRATTGAMTNLHVNDCYFENFKHNYWIYFRNDSTQDMRNVSVVNCDFVSKSGNDIDPTSLGTPACCVGFQGSVVSKDGFIRKIDVHGNDMDCSYMKSGVFAWSGCVGGAINNNNIRNCGKFGQDDKINYAIALYTNRYLSGTVDDDYDPSEFDVYSNNLKDNRDVGIYLQGLNDSTVHDNNISGQTSTADATLLKGAIVTNGVNNVDIHDNIMFGNVYDLAFAQINYKSSGEIVCTAHSNKCKSGIKIVPNVKPAGTGTGIKSTLNLYNNEIDGAVLYRISNVADNFELNIHGGYIKNSATGVGLFVFNSSTPTPLEGLWLTIKGVDFADHTQDGINVTTDYMDVLIESCKFDIGTIKNKGIALQNSKKVKWIKNHFWSSVTPSAGDHCVNVTGAEHYSYGNTTVDIGAGNKEIGFVAPTWAASEGDRVQTLRVSEQGTTPDKFFITDYIYAGNISSWVPQRIYTGN